MRQPALEPLIMLVGNALQYCKPTGHRKGNWNVSCLREMLCAGTCSLAASSSLGYNDCAVAGGVALGANNTLGALTKGQFQYTPAFCSYPSACADFAILI
jgi:hypothetical protein